MKAKTRNYSVCALVAAVLLAMAMLGTGCQSEPSTEAGYQPPAGMGAVRLSFNKAIQRTILPDEIKTINDFPVIGVEFFADDSNSTPGESLAEEFFTSVADVMAKTFNLELGDYIIKVIGYLEEGEPVTPPEDPNPPEKPAAYGEVTLSVEEEKLYSESITLKAITAPDAVEKGYFSWAIDVSGMVELVINKAQMTIASIATPTTPAVPAINLMGNWTSSEPVELAAGFYFVFFELEVVDGEKPALFRHVLHIYQNQESKFSYEFTDAYFVVKTVNVATAKITIIYEPPEDIEFVVSVGTDEYGEGDTITVTLGESIIITITNTAAFDGGIVDWYCNGETSSGLSFEIDTAEAPFDEAKLYNLSVVGIGKEDGKTYGINILIDVVEDDGP
jgi:hypothetical protein